MTRERLDEYWGEQRQAEGLLGPRLDQAWHDYCMTIIYVMDAILEPRAMAAKADSC